MVGLAAAGAWLLALAWCSRVAATRVPQGASEVDRNAIGAGLLVKTAEGCDLHAARRLMNSSSFSPGWLTKADQSGETPLKAAARSGCAEIAAALMLHPDFDYKTIRKPRLRKELVEHAHRYLQASEERVKWTLIVVEGILRGKVSQKEQEWDPACAAKDAAWFLPEPGEWMPPVVYEEMGLPKPEWPRWNLTGIAIAYNKRRFTVRTAEGVIAHAGVLDRLWFLLVASLQADEGSDVRKIAARHIRSIGWHLFFSSGREALIMHSYFIARMSHNIFGRAPAGALSENLCARGLDIDVAYRNFEQDLRNFWNRTGACVILPGRDSLTQA